jgi:NADH dehydrogenase
MPESPDTEFHAVTGAFGYSGRYITQRLLDAGHTVVTLTNSTGRPDPFAGRVKAFPLTFDQPDQLAASLRGAAVLYNTYWVRFDHQRFSHAEAVANSLTLFNAARTAGVRRIVHLSITNPSEDSQLGYFRGKATLERALRSTGLSYAILRPTVLFGRGDILINNIAWILRRFPVFGVFGDGKYRLQPIHVDDLATLAAACGARTDNVTIDAVGPETFAYRELVRTIGQIIGHPRPVVSVPPNVAYWLAQALGAWKRDVVVTRQEIRGLMEGLLYVDAPAAGPTRLTEWACDHSSNLGRDYASELGRRRQE